MTATASLKGGSSHKKPNKILGVGGGGGGTGGDGDYPGLVTSCFRNVI